MRVLGVELRWSGIGWPGKPTEDCPTVRASWDKRRRQLADACKAGKK